MVFLTLTGAMVLLGAMVYFTAIERKPQGAWDTWMIYNRAARFIYRGGEHWRDAFSPHLYWFFHADYPPLVALNTAAGWEALGQEAVRVPMLVGGAFLFGCAGLLFTGLNMYKTLGQAALALLVLFGISDFVEVGAGQIADVPLAFFILATGILVFLYALKAQKGLLVLAGASAGLAAWTKNEGLVFLLVSLVGLGVAYRKEWKRIFPWYVLGLAAPVAILVYFKVALAPPGDLFVDLASQARQIADTSRHFEILKQLGLDLRSLINWPLFVMYALVLGIEGSRLRSSAFIACLVIILLQLAGYYSILLISPHAVLWHVSALYRLLLQIGPLIVFLFFSAVKPPETIFQSE
jgi:4-amino-4-deoxy-L-arabinose transferase-like glycosyltransferase